MIAIPEMEGKGLRRVLDWCSYHTEDIWADANQIRYKYEIDDWITGWDWTFLREYRGPEIYELGMAAGTLGCLPLLHLIMSQIKEWDITKREADERAERQRAASERMRKEASRMINADASDLEGRAGQGSEKPRSKYRSSFTRRRNTNLGLNGGQRREQNEENVEADGKSHLNSENAGPERPRRRFTSRTVDKGYSPSEEVISASDNDCDSLPGKELSAKPRMTFTSSFPNWVNKGLRPFGRKGKEEDTSSKDSLDVDSQ